MPKKKDNLPRPLETDYMMIVDTETYTVGTGKKTKRKKKNSKHYAFDFGAVVINLNTGNIVPGGEMATLLPPDDIEYDLFYNPNDPDRSSFWSHRALKGRRKNYKKLFDKGLRSISRPELVNIWVRDHIASNTRPRPIIAAYNWDFDRGVCERSGIRSVLEGPLAWDDSTESGFCLMNRAKAVMGPNGILHDEYYEWCRENHDPDDPHWRLITKTGRASMKADSVAKYIGHRNNFYINEPHTALEDAKYYEAPIATFLRKNKLI